MGEQRWHRWTTPAVVLGCLLVLFVRKHQQFTLPQFWAEDGAVYFSQAREDGPESILKPHSFGQTFLAQRLIALFLRPVPPPEAPLAYFLVALGTALATCAYIANCRVRSRYRWLMAIAAVSVYAGIGAVYLQLVNIHWMFAPVLILIAASPDPETRAGRVLEAAAVALFSLSGSFGVIFAPLYVLRCFAKRSGYSVALFAIVAAAAVWQAMGTLETTRKAGAVDLNDPHWVGFVGRHLSGNLFFGDFADRMSLSEPWFLMLSIVLAWNLAAYVLLERDYEVGTIALAGVLTLAAAAWCFQREPKEIDMPGYRYYFVPTVCFAWCFLLIAERARALHFRIKAGVGLALMAFAASTAFVFETQPDLHWREASRCIGGPEPCAIQINPSPWQVVYIPRRR